MAGLLAVFLAMFAYSANRRYQLLRKVGKPIDRLDRLGTRIKAVVQYALRQEKMSKYPLAGMAHSAIFVGFVVLLVRSLVLFGRGFDPQFDLWILGEDTTLGGIYGAVKDYCVLGVLGGTAVFVYYRAVRRLPRMTLSGEGLLILGIIASMMLADLAYDGSEIVAAAREGGPAVAFSLGAPGGTLAAMILQSAPEETLRGVGMGGFWTHVSLVLIFLNILPYSKHFHIITGFANVFTMDLGHPGRLPPVTDIEGKVERGETIGLLHIDDLSWKGLLDLYTCTECGRCTDHCPANKTGKLLSPKHITIDLRNHLYAREKELIEGSVAGGDGHGHGHDAHAAHGHGDEHGHDDHHEEPDDPPHRPEALVREKVELLPHVIKPEVLWACTTCRACEEECPVQISYVDKIVEMRRALVMDKEQIPKELRSAFMGMETNRNPWNLAAMDRATWAEGLGIPVLADKPSAEWLFWVGCAASYDPRAKAIARATAQLFQLAGLDFAILGTEEGCTGDPARRAGNEYLFQILAQQNVETLGGYGVRKIVTTCPHCFNTLGNEYADFGGSFEVVHHSALLTRLVAEGRIVARESLSGDADKTVDVVFHDSCYLGRYNQIYDPPRNVLMSLPGVNLVEVEASRERGLCCGAGGAQFWKEEEHGRTRVNYERTDQLLGSGAKIIATACPFCMTMITDGLKAREREDVEQLDVAEVLLRACAIDRPMGAPAAVPGSSLAAPYRGKAKAAA